MTTEPEVLEYDLFRIALYTLVQQAQTQIGIPIMISASPGDEPHVGVYAEFDLLLGKTFDAELGGGAGGLQRTVGMIQFTVICPEKTGDGDLYRYANRLKRMFDRLQINVGPGSYFTTERFNIQTLGGRAVKKGFTAFIVDGPIDFWFRDINAMS